MYEYYATDSQKWRLRNIGFSQDMLHSSPIFTATSRGASIVRLQCIVPYHRASAVSLESDVFNSLKPREAYMFEVDYAFLGSDNDLSPVRNRATVWTKIWIVID